MSSHHEDVLERDLLQNVKKVHIVGIGGISMSAIAKILVYRGFLCTGSDKVHNDNCADVEAHGVRVFIGHEASNISDQDLVIYTAAVTEDIPEIRRAKELGIPVVGRAKFLGELMEEYENSIAVSGSHGKTSTTSMIAHILRDVLDPTVLVGGILSDNHSNVMIGDTSSFVHEACEFKDTFLSLQPKYSIILNVDEDHLDYFSGLDAIIASFRRFAQSTGHLVFYNADDPSSRKAVEGMPHKYGSTFRSAGCADVQSDFSKDSPSNPNHSLNHFTNVSNHIASSGDCSALYSGGNPAGEFPSWNGPLLISFGQSEDADYRVVDLERGAGATAKFKVEKDGAILAEIALSVPGFIYWSNAAAAFACCYEAIRESEAAAILSATAKPALDAGYCHDTSEGAGANTAAAPDFKAAVGARDMDTASRAVAAYISRRLADFANAGRRFEVYGTYRGITVVDDFAHHPNEIKAALETAVAVSPGRVIALFQPYTYSRTKELLGDFGRCFIGIDELVVSDILGGREVDPGDIHSRDVVRAAEENGVSAHLSDTLEHAGDLAMSLAGEGDMIITLGCGNVYLATRYMEERLRTDEKTAEGRDK